MELYNGILCISVPELTEGDNPVINHLTLHRYVQRYPWIRVRKGGGPGHHALLDFNQLRTDIRQRVFDKYGDVTQYSRKNKLQELIEPDFKASKFFRDYLLDGEKEIKPERQVEYNANATVLNAIAKYEVILMGKSNRLGIRRAGLWNVISRDVNLIDKARYPHSLPSNPIRLKEKCRQYQQQGYESLIHKGMRNSNAAKRTAEVDRMIVSLYCQRNIPFGEWVYDDYMQFLAGAKTIVDKQSGVIFDREDYFDYDKGCYRLISRATVWNIIHDPRYAAIIDRMRNNRIDHITQMCPFDKRKRPEYSLSMISMDDRTFSRKTLDGQWLNAYVAADVMSEVILGITFSTNRPTVEMIKECFREMLKTLDDDGLMWPGELECENALMKNIEPQLRQMFQYVTFCTPGIGRSKFIENLFRRKKYMDEKRYQVGIGRWNGKGAFKTKSESKDEEYKQPRLPIETLIADELASIERWNHDLHPNQKRFPGKTRWQVLIENMHPDLGRPQKYKILKHIGLLTETSIRNQDYVQVKYERYTIDRFESLERLSPNNYGVQAFYIADKDGSISEVFLYQNENFITRATKIEQYQKSKLERTDEDERIRTDQAKRSAHYFKREREAMDNHLVKEIEVIKPDTFQDAIPVIVDIPEPIEVNDVDEGRKKFEDLDWKKIAVDNI